MLCRLFALSRRELVVLVAAFAVSLPAVTSRIYASDEIEYFSYLRSLWFDHDLSFENEYQYFYDRDVARAEGFHTTFLEDRTDAGRRPNFATIGCALLWSPFYAVGDVTARLMHAAGGSTVVDGFSRPYIAAVAFGSAVYGFLAVLLSIAAARRLLASAHATATRDDSILSALVVWLGTPLLFYMYVAPPMSHACSAFAVALFVTIWLRIRRTWTLPQVMLLGVAAALMTMVREQDAFVALGPAVDFAVSQLTLGRGHELRRSVVTAAAGCVVFAVAMLPQLVAYQLLNGHVGPSHTVSNKMTWTAPHAAEVLFSPAHGFFFWTPLAALAIAGLIALALRYRGEPRRVSLIALLMVALQVYVSGSVESWNVAGAFGQRRFVALTIILVIGLAGIIDSARGGLGRGAVLLTAGICVWWNLGMIALFGTRLMDRKQIEIGRNAYDVFVTLPRLAPTLAYRYATDRTSFYRSAPTTRLP